jgi:hypothetical protein
LYCARFTRIVSTADHGASFRDEGRLAVPFHKRLTLVMPLLQRLTRSQIYRMRVLPNGGKIYVFRKGIYAQASGERVAKRTFAVTRGSRPVSLATGRDGLTVFGEYWDNAERTAVHIYGSSTGGMSWNPVYTFPAGSIRHVHGISYDAFENCYWICTGDYDGESQLLRASADFADVEIVRQGGQANRFYYILVREDCLVTATDTPLEDNFICMIDKATGALRQVAPIENTNFYSCQVGHRLVFSTNAETSEVNDTRTAHVWCGDATGDSWHKLAAFSLDPFARLAIRAGLGAGLLQYSSVFFPEGENPDSQVLVCYGIGVHGYDNAMFCYDTRDWDV